MKINSLQFHFDELEISLANCPIDFQIVGITESRLKEANPPTTNIILPGTYAHKASALHQKWYKLQTYTRP